MVSAVFENMPQQSSIRFDMLLSLDIVRKNFPGNGDWQTVDTDWGNYHYATFFKLKPGVNTTQLEKELDEIQVKNNPYSKSNYLLQPLNTLRLYNADLSPSGIHTVRMFLLTGVLILIISVINYVNLSTARTTKRAREVGLRQVVGAGRKNLLIQFIIEFMVIFCLALLLAVILLSVFTPQYQAITEKNYPVEYWSTDSIRIVTGVAIGTFILASLYPAWLLSSFRPREVLKCGFSKSGGSTFRKWLVLIQFSSSIALIICTIAISRQLHYIMKKDIGYNRENIFVVPLSEKIGKQTESIIQYLEKEKAVADASYASDNLVGFFASTDNIRWPGMALKDAQINKLNVAANFTNLLKIKLAAGNGFTGTPADSGYFLINEAAVKMMELKNPVGMKIYFQNTPGLIRGVMKDFNSGSLKERVQPTIFRIKPSQAKKVVLYVKAREGFAREAVANTERIIRSFDSEYPFEYHFLDETFDRMYHKDIQAEKLFRYFAAVAIFLSCMGLFGLSVFTAERRTREMGIRKVLGAGPATISILIAKEFTLLVLISNGLAWPVAWYFIHDWLQEFAYRTEINIGIFLFSGGIAFIFALLTVSGQSLKISLANPVDSLRTE